MLPLLVVLALAADGVAPAEAPQETTATTTPAAPATMEPTSTRRLRIVVQDVSVVGEERLQAILLRSLVAELRKLDSVSVVGMDEVRALVEQEATRQLAACSESGCLAELADALGADVVVNAVVTTVGAQRQVSFRRLDVATATATGVDSLFAKGDGEEVLAALGDAVAALFPERALHTGATRGVQPEVARQLNPPPLPPWVLASGVVATVVVAGAGGVAGGLSLFFQESAQQKVDASASSPVRGVDVKADIDAASSAAVAANVLFVAAGALAVGSGVVVLFTNFAGDDV